MSFSVKQLLAVVLIISAGFAALANADKVIVNSMTQFAVLIVLVLVAYGNWVSDQEARAFRIGFLAWGGIYFLFHVVMPGNYLNLGTDWLLYPLLNTLQPEVYERDSQGVITGVHGGLQHRFLLIGHRSLTLFVGLIGGWVTVYFYRKRQRMLEKQA